jgi:hypothetical protein
VLSGDAGWGRIQRREADGFIGFWIAEVPNLHFWGVLHTIVQMSLKHELQNIISGNGSVSHGKTIRTITDYLSRKKEAVSGIEKGQFLKEQEVEVLIALIAAKGLWYEGLDESKYIGEGAEQRIYEHSDSKFVIKLNDGVFYAFWED